MMGRPVVPGSRRSLVHDELLSHPDGVMAADVAVWAGVGIHWARSALDSLVTAGHAYWLPAQTRGGGGKPTKRYFSATIPRPIVAPKPIEPSAPVVRPRRQPAMTAERTEWREYAGQMVRVTICPHALEYGGALQSGFGGL